MFLLGAKVLVLGVLMYASVEDLKNQMVHDKVFLFPVPIVLVLGFVDGGIGFAGSMLVQGLIAFFIGLLIKAVGTFGGADIWSIVISSMVYPDLLIFTILAFLLVPMIFWIKIYGFFSRSEKGPAIPGIMLGYFALLSYFL